MRFIYSTNGISFGLLGSTALSALKPLTPSLNAGKIFKPSAAELIAEKHSDGVKAPGAKAYLCFL